MLDNDTRAEIMKAFGDAVDSVVRDHYRGLSQEPALTSRIGQNIEVHLDDRRVGEYVFRVITQDLPDRGPGSLEKLTGADLFLSVSLEGPGGFDKGVFVQTKFDHKLNRADLQDQCKRMKQISRSSYVWVYTADGVSVLSAEGVGRMQGNGLNGLQTRSVAGFFGRILDCYAGSQSLGIPPVPDRRAVLAQRLKNFRARHGIDVELEHTSARERPGIQSPRWRSG